jgi:conjugal transfer/type IV secretion protein DotA/TraY
MPYFETYPDVMDQTRRERKKADADLSSKMQFNPNLAEGRPVTLACPTNCLEVAKLMNDFFNWWNKDDPDMEKASKTVSSSVINDVVGAIFGMSGLMEMRGDNAHIHPLAQLAAVGKSLVDSAIINIGGSTITAGAGGLLRLMDSHTGPLAGYASGMMMTIAMLAMTIGFILFYVLPFLPFLYFFFAFGTWIKSIFEAMVGAPLWALAHLRIDGEGLPGDSASSGYFLIFEIFVRPILTVFGLVAAVLIFTAQVRMLNVLWELVTSSLTGFEGWTETGPGAQQNGGFAESYAKPYF